MEILTGVFRKSLFVIVPSIALAVYFFGPRAVPLGIFTGWIFGIFNLRSLTKSVQSFVGANRPKGVLIFLSIFRLLLMFAVITVLLYYRVIHVLGLLFGFTVVFAWILIEGMRIGKTRQKMDN